MVPDNSIERMLKQDEREKRKAFPRQGTAKKRPRRITMPGDLIDRRREPTYRTGKVEIRSTRENGQGKEATLENIPTYGQFKRMPDKERRELLISYCRKYGDDTLIKAMGAPPHGFRAFRQKTGILRTEPGNLDENDDRNIVVIREPENEGCSPILPVTNEQYAQETPEVTATPSASMEKEGMFFTLNGNYSPGDLQKKFLAIASLFEEGLFDSQAYAVRLTLEESEKRKPAVDQGSENEKKEDSL